jgi:hypothetical protein
MQDSAATNSRGAFHIITMKSDIASLDKNIPQASTKTAMPSVPVFNKTEAPKAIPQQPAKTPVQLKDSDLEYKKPIIPQKNTSTKPQSVVDPDLIELSGHDAIIDVPPPPPQVKSEKPAINLEIDVPPPAPKNPASAQGFFGVKPEEKSVSFAKDDFELQIENPFKEDSKKSLDDIANSYKLEKEKDTIAKTFGRLAGEQNPALEKVVVGKAEPIPAKPAPPPIPKPEIKADPLPTKPQSTNNPNDDLSIYDKKEVVNPNLIKEVKSEVAQDLQPKKIEVKTFQAPEQAKPAFVPPAGGFFEAKPEPKPEIKIEIKPEPPKDPIAQKLLEIEKEKEKIKEERKIVYADCKKELTEIEIQKEKQNKIKFDFLGKIKDIKFNELEPLLNQEQILEKQLITIKEQEKTASTVEQEEMLFAKRSDIENKRQDTEKKRWQTEDKIQNLKIQIKDAEAKIDQLAEQERSVNAKREAFNNKVEKIEYQEKRWLLEKDLTALKTSLEKLSNEYANLIPEKDKLNSSLRDVLISKTELDKEISVLETQEAGVPFEKKREFEQKRQQKESQRQIATRKAIDARKKKEEIERRINELSSSINDIEAKEKDIKTRIQTIEKALQEN